MAVDLETFLSPVVESAATLAQVREPVSNDVAVDDPILLECSKIAYAQVSIYCQRDFRKDTYTEYYTDEDTRILLRESPVTTVTSVTDKDGVLILDTDYQVQGDWLIMGATPENTSPLFNYDIYDSGLSRYNLLVVYEGGYDVSTDNNYLHSGLVAQTIANYNRKDNLGIVRAQGSDGGQLHMTDTYNPDAGNIVESCIYSVSSLVYYGSAKKA